MSAHMTRYTVLLKSTAFPCVFILFLCAVYTMHGSSSSAGDEGPALVVSPESTSAAFGDRVYLQIDNVKDTTLKSLLDSSVMSDMLVYNCDVVLKSVDSQDPGRAFRIRRVLPDKFYTGCTVVVEVDVPQFRN